MDETVQQGHTTWGYIVARIRIGAVALGLVTSLLFALGLVAPAQAETPAESTLSISGELVVITDFGADLTLDEHDHDHGSESGPEPQPASPELTYSVITDDGQLVAVDGDFSDSARTGDRFEGTVVIPDPVASDLAVAPGTAVDGDTELGEDVVDAAASEDDPMVVDEAQVVSAPVQNSVTPGVHTMDVVVVSSAMADGDIAPLTSKVGAYWVTETDGGISEFTQPLARTTLTAACPTTQAAYNAVWTSAAATFGRTAGDYTNGNGRHLVVILPSACNSSTGTGLGTIGTSVHQGGLNFVSNYSDIATTTLAHEIGHNIGLGHGNLNYCGTLAYDEGSGCSFYEYNDVYSVMGYALVGYGTSLPALPASQKDFLQALPSGDLAVQAPTSGAPLSKVTHTLKPVSDSSGLRGIKVTDPYTGLIYYVELRSGTGIDADAFYAEGFTWGLNGNGADVIGTDRGVRVLQLDTSQPTQKGAMSKVFAVVTNPAEPNFAFSALHPDEDFNSRSGGLNIHVDALLPNSDNPTSATVTISTGGWTGDNPPPTVTRISGADRFAVGVAISQSAFPGNPANVPVVYVTTGYKYPDALSAAPAATKYGGPLLLTAPDALPTAVRNEIIRLSPAKIVVVGGPASVTPAVFSDLQTLSPTPSDTIRLGGADRFEASRNIVEDAWCESPTVCAGATGVYIATGNNFPDALSASGAGGAFDLPVILVNGTASTLDAATRALLLRLDPSFIKIAGGPASVSAGIEADLAAIAPGATTRLSGADRFAASLNVATDAFSAPTSAYIATGYNFPDALAGAAIAGAKSAPLIVVPTNCVPQATLDAIDAWELTSVTLLGGPVSLTSRVFSMQSC